MLRVAPGSSTLGLLQSDGASPGVVGKEGAPSQRGVLHAPTGCSLPSLGYLGYASGFSLSCMGFFLISVSA